MNAKFTVAVAVAGSLAFTVLVRAESDQKLAAGAGSFQFVDEQGNRDRPLTIWTYVPENARANMPIVFVMHGVRRNGSDYRDNWIEHAQSKRFVLVAPEFSLEAYPSEAYQRGNMLNEAGEPIDPSMWTFATIEHLFDRVKEMSGNTSKGYFIYGHSAGGQFVHRLVMFMPEARYIKAVAANPGYYTVPSGEIDYPYGLRGTAATDESLKVVFSRRFTLLLGEEDTDGEDPNLNKTPGAEAQGANRLERGKYFFQQAKEAAGRLATGFLWKVKVIPDAGHSDRKMSEQAVREFFVSP